MSVFEREENDSDEEMPLLIERFRRFVRLTTSPPKNDEPACYETNKSQIGSTKSNGLGRSIGPHRLH